MDLKNLIQTQIFSHYTSAGWIVMVVYITMGRFLPLYAPVLGVVVGSAVKEFYFDRKVQPFWDQFEDFVFLVAGGFFAAALIRCFGVYA